MHQIASVVAMKKGNRDDWSHNEVKLARQSSQILIRTEKQDNIDTVRRTMATEWMAKNVGVSWPKIMEQEGQIWSVW